jgi:4-hydroxythreonine-4-phosphate dehydrogenase
MNKRRRIGITMGDAAGVGPELCLRVLNDPQVCEACVPVVFGSASVLAMVADMLALPLPPVVEYGGDWKRSFVEHGGIADYCGLDGNMIKPGRVQAIGGTAAYCFVEHAVRSCLAGSIDAVVTAPINKAALHQAGIPYAGHTEMLADMTGCRDYCMMMASDELRVCLVTTHTAIADVAGLLSEERILKVIRLAMGLPVERGEGKTPHLTVCGLNPHAGEAGAFGDEESRLIMPAIERARSLGSDVEGPLPPDTAFMPAVRERTDAYIVMYHDQGLIPFKMLAFDKGVNVTLGLPIVRTSPDHGTAYDIAWQGMASPDSMVAAVRMALDLADRQAED